MAEVVLWVLIWANWDYGGFVTKVEEFGSQEACAAFARDVQSRRKVIGTPYCVKGKVLRAQAQEGQ